MKKKISVLLMLLLAFAAHFRIAAVSIPSAATASTGNGSPATVSGSYFLAAADAEGGDNEASGSVELKADGTNSSFSWTSGTWTASFDETNCGKNKSYVKVNKEKSATLSISSTGGENITKVVLTYGEKPSSTSDSEVTFTLPSTSSNTDIGSVAKNSDGSVTITFSNTKDIYASKVVVYYGGSTPSTQTYTITAKAENGTVAIAKADGTSVTSGTSVDAGTALTITATANSGYEFSSWTVDGTTGTANGNVYTISSIAANTTVTANFVEAGKTVTYAVENKTYTRNEAIWNSDNSVRVALGGWMFPNTVKPKISSETFGDSEKDWGKTQTPKSDGDEYVSAYQYQIGEGGNGNPRQENGSNSQPMSTKIWSNDSKNKVFKDEGSVVDPMFNVPCSGAYLVFTAKKPGTIVATIFQNGVFDVSNSKNQYRPQRRVFVLDNGGNIISTKAKLENEKGSLPSNTLSDYTWDFGTMPTNASDVQAHFVGLTNFSTSSFKNGVYESALSYDVCKNEALNDASLKDVTGKGYRGWAVLADAPVSYTFDVLPGKTYYLYNFGSRIGFYGFTFTPKTGVTTDNVTLNEDQDTQSIAATAQNHMAQVSLDRKFKGGVWNAAVLPFSMNKQQIDEIFGATYSTGNTDGTQIVYFDRVHGDSCYFVRHAYNTIVAGKPFLIKPSKTGDITLNTANVTDFPYVTIENTEPAEWCATGDWAWASSYANQTINPGDHYINTSGSLSARTSGSVKMKGFRGFLKAKSSEAKQVKLFIGNGDNTSGDSTTGIMALEIDGNGNFVERPVSGSIYSINGQLMGTGASQFDSLPAGVYIVNGKKFVK